MFQTKVRTAKTAGNAFQTKVRTVKAVGDTVQTLIRDIKTKTKPFPSTDRSIKQTVMHKFIPLRDEKSIAQNNPSCWTGHDKTSFIPDSKTGKQPA
ncbi:MAG: hypothetical protein LBP50_02630 [Tannerella sp.]|nr:hypothetical protein [Tannerella sp.]